MESDTIPNVRAFNRQRLGRGRSAGGGPGLPWWNRL